MHKRLGDAKVVCMMGERPVIIGRLPKRSDEADIFWIGSIVIDIDFMGVVRIWYWTFDPGYDFHHVPAYIRDYLLPLLRELDLIALCWIHVLWDKFKDHVKIKMTYDSSELYWLIQQVGAEIAKHIVVNYVVDKTNYDSLEQVAAVFNTLEDDNKTKSQSFIDQVTKRKDLKHMQQTLYHCWKLFENFGLLDDFDKGKIFGKMQKAENFSRALSHLNMPQEWIEEYLEKTGETLAQLASKVRHLIRSITRDAPESGDNDESDDESRDEAGASESSDGRGIQPTTSETLDDDKRTKIIKILESEDGWKNFNRGMEDNLFKNLTPEQISENNRNRTIDRHDKDPFAQEVVKMIVEKRIYKPDEQHYTYLMNKYGVTRSQVYFAFKNRMRGNRFKHLNP